MSDEMIDSIMAEATQADPTTTTETQTDQQDNTDAPQGEPKDPWPKAAENAYQRQKRQAAKYKAQYRELEAVHSELKARIEKLENPAPREPREEDFDNYGDYLRAYAVHNAKGAQPEQPNEKPLSRDEAIQLAQEQLHVQQQAQTMQQQSAKLMQEVPEYRSLHADYADVLEDMPQGTVQAFMNLKNAPAAFYALAKEGVIEQLPNLTPMQAAIELARAEARGEQMIAKIKSQTTKAPSPMTGVKGTASTDSIENMTGDSILKAIRQ